jgi:hypothetical protein
MMFVERARLLAVRYSLEPEPGSRVAVLVWSVAALVGVSVPSSAELEVLTALLPAFVQLPVAKSLMVPGYGTNGIVHRVQLEEDHSQHVPFPLLLSTYK